ncbi:MAG: DUF1499 domain-containing protein [Gammaproteobacteria bacterium]|nr:DUF1499 domain-containing protein [Gammaproteobacteria bacterium]
MTLDMTSNQTRRVKLLLKFASILVAAAGIILGLLTLASAAGIWLGAWDFRRGFDLLRMANDYGDVIAWTCLAITVVIVFAARLWNTGNALRLGTLAATGTLIAGIAYAIPESCRPPEGVNYQPIHDISTDLVSPPEFVAILPLRAAAPNTVVYGGTDNMTPERLAELTREAYPDLVPRTYPEPIAPVFTRAVAAVSELGWELVAADQSAGRIEATATTFWFRFKDDIVITFAETTGQTLVNARSVSRVGVGDVGANALRLRKFFALL